MQQLYADEQDGPNFISQTLTEHIQFLVRNMTPRSLFANLLALGWILCATRMVRWLNRVRGAR